MILLIVTIILGEILFWFEVGKNGDEVEKEEEELKPDSQLALLEILRTSSSSQSLSRFTKNHESEEYSNVLKTTAYILSYEDRCMSESLAKNFF